MSYYFPPIGLARAVLELLGIVLARFRLVPRVWAAWLVAVNSASLAFITHVEAQVALAAVGAALLAQALIYRRRRFIRLLGVTHVLWVPMLAWMAPRLVAIPASEPAFHAWLLALIVTNAVSLAVDLRDAARYALGERTPYYTW